MERVDEKFTESILERHDIASRGTIGLSEGLLDQLRTAQGLSARFRQEIQYNITTVLKVNLIYYFT